MGECTKNIELMYGEAKIIASKVKTSPAYVRNVLSRYRSGKKLHGAVGKNIIKQYNKMNP